MDMSFFNKWIITKNTKLYWYKEKIVTVWLFVFYDSLILKESFWNCKLHLPWEVSIGHTCRYGAWLMCMFHLRVCLKYFSSSEVHLQFQAMPNLSLGNFPTAQIFCLEFMSIVHRKMLFANANQSPESLLIQNQVMFDSIAELQRKVWSWCFDSLSSRYIIIYIYICRWHLF